MMLLEVIMPAESMFIASEDPAEHFTFLYARHTLSICYHEQRRYAEVGKHYRLLIKGLESHIGTSDFKLCKPLYSYGNLLRRQKRYIEAQKMLSRCVEYYRPQAGQSYGGRKEEQQRGHGDLSQHLSRMCTVSCRCFQGSQ